MLRHRLVFLSERLTSNDLHLDVVGDESPGYIEDCVFKGASFLSKSFILPVFGLCQLNQMLYALPRKFH